MRIKYLPKDLDTNSRFWDRNLSTSDIEDALNFCEISPLREVFDKYLPKQGRILDGGCGLGQYVIYYRRKGYDVYGIDFAAQTIKRTLEYDKSIPLIIGDVARLPYPDNYFSAYYSGGVVEHFEEGPYRALKEAHRVLSQDGLFIISVPYLNLTRLSGSYLRYILTGKRFFGPLTDHNGVHSAYMLAELNDRLSSPFENFSFYQYEYTKSEFTRILKECNFEIIMSRGVSIIWGLMDYSLIRFLSASMKKRRNAAGHDYQSHSQETPASFSQRIKSHIKKIIINEDYSLVSGRIFLSLLNNMYGNLILFVCKVKK